MSTQSTKKNTEEKVTAGGHHAKKKGCPHFEVPPQSWTLN